MEWSYVRIDKLPPGASCTFCHRQLKSGKGLVIANAQGEEHYSGPSCAKAHVGDPEERILDVTRIALSVVVKEATTERAKPADNPGPENPGPDTGPQVERRPPPPPLDEVHAYTRMRVEMLKRFRAHSNETLNSAHAALVAGTEIQEPARTRISGLMRNAERDNTIFSAKNVTRCVAFEYWLSEALEYVKSDRREFLQSMLSTLRSKWKLTEGQVQAINRWGQVVRKVVDDFPLLDDQAFVGMVTPEFMKSKPKKSAPQQD
jgi:hypothetical protein